jgi:RimJ/RimL family protein N-acetyltransferase
MLELREFIREDMDNIDLGYEMLQSHKDAFKAPYAIHGYTLLEDGEIVAMGGVHMLWDKVGEAWVMLGKNAKSRPRTVAKYADLMFDVIVHKNKLNRVQASIAVNDAKAVRFGKWMGFEMEGLMRRYGPDGSDYYRVARVQ